MAHDSNSPNKKEGSCTHVVNDTISSISTTSTGAGAGASGATSASGASGASAAGSCRNRVNSSTSLSCIGSIACSSTSLLTNSPAAIRPESFLESPRKEESATGSTKTTNATINVDNTTQKRSHQAKIMINGSSEQEQEEEKEDHPTSLSYQKGQTLRAAKFKCQRRLALNRASARLRREKKQSHLLGLKELNNSLLSSNEAISRENKEMVNQISILMSMMEKTIKEGEISTLHVPAPSSTSGNIIVPVAGNVTENSIFTRNSEEVGASSASSNQALPASMPHQSMPRFQHELFNSLQSQQEQLTSLTFPTNDNTQEQVVAQSLPSLNELKNLTLELQQQQQQMWQMLQQAHSSTIMPLQLNAPLTVQEIQSHLQSPNQQQQQQDVSNQQSSSSSCTTLLTNAQLISTITRDSHGIFPGFFSG